MLVYTAIIGPAGGRLLGPGPAAVSPGVDFVCLTDRDDVQSDAWQVRHVSEIRTPGFAEASNRVKSRWIKTCMHVWATNWWEGYDRSLWIDSDLELLVDPRELAYEGADLVATKHPRSETTEQEVLSIEKRGLAEHAPLWAQLRRYRREWSRSEQRLVTCGGFLLRQHSDRVRAFNDLWWSEYNRYVNYHERDQVSIDYCLWKANLRTMYLSGHYLNSGYVKWHP